MPPLFIFLVLYVFVGGVLLLGLSLHVAIDKRASYRLADSVLRFSADRPDSWREVLNKDQRDSLEIDRNTERLRKAKMVEARLMSFPLEAYAKSGALRAKVDEMLVSLRAGYHDSREPSPEAGQ